MVNRLFHALAHSDAIGFLTPFLIGQRQIFGGILYTIVTIKQFDHSERKYQVN